MNDVIDSHFSAYQLMRPLDPDRLSKFKAENYPIY